MAVIQLVLILFIGFGFYESQRFNFEYAFYTRITKFTKYILGEENLKKNYSGDFKNITAINSNDKNKGNYRNYNNLNNNYNEKEKVQMDIFYSKEQQKIQTELNNNLENENASFINGMIFGSNYNFIENNYNYNYNFIENNHNVYNKGKYKYNPKENIIRRSKILTDPLYLNKLMNKEKQIKKHFLLIISLISSLSIVANLGLNKIVNQIFLPREKLISIKTIFDSHLSLFVVIYFITLFPFVHYSIKCIGLSFILILSLIITVVFSFFYEIFCLSSRELTDLNESLYNSIEIVNKKYNKTVTLCVYMVLISTVGLQYSVYFYLTKLTKTIYRCSFYGHCQVFIDLNFIISLFLENNIEKTYSYVCLFGIIALINSFFITSNEDSINITDIREIKFDDKKG